MKKMRFYSILLIAIGIIPFLLANLLGNFQENFFEEPHEPLPSSPSSLKTVWYRTWGGLENDLAMELAIDLFDNIYLSGYIRDNETGELDRVCIVKYNTTGDLQWNRTWGEDFTFTIRPLIDNHNNIYIAGTTKIRRVVP